MTAGLIVRQGEPGFLEPGSVEWARIITPSKVTAILGLSRWESPFSLWHRMKGITAPEEPKVAFDIGHDIEPFAANRWLRANPGWKVSVGEVQFHVPAGHFPFPAVGTIDRRTLRGSWRRILEVKLARDLSALEDFGDDLSGDCPEDFAAQVTAQRLFVAATQPSVRWEPTSHLLAMGPYFNERIYEIEYDLDVATWIIDECTTFWRSLQSDTPPDLDDKVATYKTLKELHPDIDPDGEVQLDPDLAVEFLAAKAAEKAAKSAVQGTTNRVAAAMENAHYARVGEVTVADRRSNGKGGVSLYAGRSATPDQIRHLAGGTTE